ncbi:MAG: enoyl-CoA hydratase/isomerase family protein, partial [Oligoflexia bacterium]|nr:enoyl-CoA hydratase/isomerase family protein [Oligoflexia bacterium]
MPIHASITDNIAVICLDRPDRANAYDQAHLTLLEQALDQILAQRPGALIIQAAGPGAFCGGADLSEVAHADPLDALDLRSQRVFDRLARAPVVSIAAVHGPAIAGGCELALACDLRVVGPQARFGLPETALGLIPSAGGTTRLTRLLGGSMARQVILAGVELDAQRAVDLGLAVALDDDPQAYALTV